MGTYTDFTGAIRITPCLKDPLAGRFRQFLGIRHMKRDVKILEALFPTLEERKAVTLFGDGDFGEDGAFFLPIHTRDLTRRICLHERYAEGLTDERDMNMTPGPCPSLYCDLELRNDPDNGHSYLGWNEAEKAYYITDWIGYIAEWLSKLGYGDIIDRSLLLAGTFLHDFAKESEFTFSQLGLVTEYSVKGQLLGHLVMGAQEVANVATELGIPEDKSVLLQHMILSHHGEPEFSAAVKPICAESELLSQIDMLDSRMEIYRETLAGLQVGEVSNRIFALDKRVFKPHELNG